MLRSELVGVTGVARIATDGAIFGASSAFRTFGDVGEFRRRPGDFEVKATDSIDGRFVGF